jgi:hypothetical protein
MIDCGIGPITRRVIYSAVRSFGWRSWRNKANTAALP